ncbi:MAG: DUF4347 domain-containing protein [Synechococcus sp.]|nr:DUF4347 domain-containing protein [Synechococcus sp.]
MNGATPLQQLPILLAYDEQLVEVELLLAGLDRDVLPVAVARQADAIATITAALAASGARRLILLGHGAPGRLQLGSRPLCRELIETEQQTIAAWGLQALDLYACHVGADRQMLAQLQRAAGCPLAASAGPVGHRQLQGSWNLAVRLGETETAANRIIPFSRQARQSWTHTLIYRYVGGSYVGNIFTQPNYSSIWDAVWASSSGDELVIASGNYNEPFYGSTVNVSGSLITISNDQPGASYISRLSQYWSGSISLASVTQLSGTASEITAVFTDGSISGLNNPFLTVSDSSLAAATILDLDARTNKLISFSASSMSGSASEITSVYGAISSGSISGLANAVPTITDATINASQIIAVDLLTTLVPIFTATTITGSLSDIYSAYFLYQLGGFVTGLGNESVTISGVISATEAQNIATYTTGAVTATISPDSAAALLAAITESGNHFSLSLTDTTLGASSLIALNNLTTAPVDATSVTAVSGSIADLLSVYGNAGILNLGKETVTITDTTATAANLKSLLNLLPGGSIDASTLTTISGNEADLAFVITSSSITRSPAIAVTIDSGTSATAVNLNTIDANTTGVINATSISSITGSAEQVALALSSTGITRSAAVNVTLEGGAAQASDLNSIDSRTTATINAAALTTVSGSAVDLYAVYSSTGFSGLGNEPIILTDGSADAALLSALKLKTSGIMNAGSLTQLTGSVMDCNLLYVLQAAGAISGLGDEDIQISGTLSVAEANNLDAYTSGVITATIEPSSITDLLTLNGGNNAYTLTISDSTASAMSLFTLDTKTTIPINATAISSLTGSPTVIAAVLNASGIDTSETVGAIVDGGSVNAGDLSLIAGATSGTINALAVTTLTGTAAAIASVLSTSSIQTAAGVSISIAAGSADASDLSTIANETGGAVDATAITTLTGSAAAIATLLNTATVSLAAGLIVQLSAGSANAADLNTIDSKVSTEVNATALTTLTGTAAAIATAINASTIATAANVAVLVNSGTATVSQANAIDAQTTGVITASLSNGDMSDLAGLTGTDNAYSITITDTSADAAALNSLDEKTTVVVNAKAITSLTGTATAISSAMGADQIDLANNVAVNVTSGTATVSQANTIDAATTGVVTATLAAGDMASLATLSGSGNAYSITVTDTSLDAAALNNLNSKTSVDLNIAAVTTISGTLTNLKIVYEGSGIQAGNLGNETLKLSDTSLTAANLGVLNALNLSTSGDIDAASLTLITGSLADVVTAHGGGIINLNNTAITINDASLNDANLVTLESINGKTSGNINLGSVTSMAGSIANLLTLYTATGYSGLGNETISLTDTTTTATNLSNLDKRTTGVIDASSLTSLSGNLTEALSAYGSAGLSGLGNESVTLTDTSVTAANLNSLDARTTGTITATPTEITGTLAALTSAYTSSGISLAGTEAVALTDTSVNAGGLNTLSTAYTTGIVNAGSVTSITGSLTELNTLYADASITGLGNESLTLSDTITVAAAALNTLNDSTVGVVNMGSVPSVSGSMAELLITYNASGFTGRGNEDLILGAGNITATDINTLDARTSGRVMATDVGSVTGSMAHLLTAYGSTGITGLGVKAATLTDSKVSAANLNSLNGRTTAAIDAGSLTSISGISTDLITAYNAATAGEIKNLGNESLTLSDTAITAASLSSLNSLTLGLVNAGSLTKVSGDLATLASVYLANDGLQITGLGNETIVLTDKTTLTAVALNSLKGKTSGTLDITTVPTISGNLADLLITYNATGYAGRGNEAIVLGATAVSASDLNSLDSRTTGSINAAAITSVEGSITDLLKAYASTGITGLGSRPAILADSLVTATNLNKLDLLATGSIDVTSMTSITGKIADLSSTYSSSGIANLGNKTIIITDTSLVAAGVTSLNSLNQNMLTSGLIVADSVVSLTGSLATLNAIYAANDGTQISGLGNEAIRLSDTASVLASDLNTLDNKTTGVISIASIPAVSGLISDVLLAFGSNGFTGRSKQAVVLSDLNATAEDLNRIDSLTTGIVNASSVTKVSGSLANLITTYKATGISGLGNETIELTDSTAAPLDVSPLQSAMVSKASNNSSYSINYLGANLNDTATGYALNDVLNGGIGNDTLNGAGGADTLIGGAGKDTLTGGTTGGGDTFVYSALNQSLLSGFDVITDFQIGTDFLDGPVAVSAADVKKPGSVTALTEKSIATLLTAANLPANGAAIFTFGSAPTRTFLVLNDAVAGYRARSDALIEITGYSGSLSSLAVV